MKRLLRRIRVALRTRWDRLRIDFTRGAPVRARWRERFSRHRLPPGPFLRLDQIEPQDRTFLIRHAAEHGPVFKAVWMEEMWVCIVGIPRCRRFVKECGDHIRLLSLRLDRFIPKGFLRQLEGDEHRHYRRALTRAIRPGDLTEALPDLERIVRDILAAHAAGQRGEPATAEEFIRVLDDVATGLLLRVFYGVMPGSAAYGELLAGYRKLGPCGLVWNFGRPQDEAYAELVAALGRLHLGGAGPATGILPGSVLGRAREGGDVDATLLGNIVYMVETGRYDMYSLFRWMVKYASEFPAHADRVASEAALSAEGGPFTEAFVRETLRTDQSARLMRKVEREVVFDGHLIPAGTVVRLCMWESHHDGERYPDPFRFDPERFLAGEPGPDEFSPFGIDHHQCPLGTVATRLSRVFLRELCRGYRLKPTGDGLPMRGMFHWEPSSAFSVGLEQRGAAWG